MIAISVASTSTISTFRSPDKYVTDPRSRVVTCLEIMQGTVVFTDI